MKKEEIDWSNYTDLDEIIDNMHTIQFKVDRKKNSIWKRIKEILKFIFIGKMEFEL